MVVFMDRNSNMMQAKQDLRASGPLAHLDRRDRRAAHEELH